MHIILGALGVIVTILILLRRLSDAGIDIGWLNPFTWQRRRAWRKQYEGNPVFSLDEPIEVAAMLATSIAKIDGDFSKEEKALLLSLFQSEFGQDEKGASDLLMSSIYIFNDGEDALAKPDKVMKRALDKFTEDQAKSVIELLTAIKDIDVTNNTAKNAFLDKVQSTFDAHFKVDQKW